MARRSYGPVRNPVSSPVFPVQPAHEETRVAAIAMSRVWENRSLYCAKCNHIGRIFAEDLSIYPDGGHFVTRPCSCAAAGDIGTKSLLRDCGVPSTYQTASLENWSNTGRIPAEVESNNTVLRGLRVISARITEAMGDGLNIWIWGRTAGVGKTWLAVGLMRAAIMRGVTGRFIDAASLQRVAIDDKDELSAMHEAGVLVIDGVERLSKSRTDFAEGVLIDLMAYRIANRNMTIFTSAAERSSVESLANMLADNTAFYQLRGGRYETGVGSKWQTQ